MAKIKRNVLQRKGEVDNGGDDNEDQDDNEDDKDEAIDISMTIEADADDPEAMAATMIWVIH